MKTFYDFYEKNRETDFNSFFNSVTGRGVERALEGKTTGSERLRALISPAAGEYLEDMAGISRELTIKNFGKTIQLYTPLYLSDFCDNGCVYCSFNAGRDIDRKKLSTAEVEKEAGYIAASGLRHVLILTGDSRKESPLEYILECVAVLKKFFRSISIEIYALDGNEYGSMIKAGVDGLTIYQEVYDEEIYKKMHTRGPKSDYRFRLEAPERAADKGMRLINIGSLLGLNEWRKEAFFLGMHAEYLQDRFPSSEISVSLPRIRPYSGGRLNLQTVPDTGIVQMLVALRIFIPRLGITLSTREEAVFRDNLVFLGVTRMSAGSTTIVGGHSIPDSLKCGVEQFTIADNRSIGQIRSMLREKGYQAVLQDWW